MTREPEILDTSGRLDREPRLNHMQIYGYQRLKSMSQIQIFFITTTCYESYWENLEISFFLRLFKNLYLPLPLFFYDDNRPVKSKDAEVIPCRVNPRVYHITCDICRYHFKFFSNKAHIIKWASNIFLICKWRYEIK